MDINNTNTENRSYIYQVELDSKQINDARVIASNFIEDNAKVLDVGCACGDFGRLISTEKKCHVFGMEYDAVSIVEAKKKKVYHQIDQVDLNTFQTKQYSEYYNYFDYITLLDVLEHTIWPEDSLLKLKPYLKEDGFIITSLPNISFGDVKLGLLDDDLTYTDMGILDKTHLRFFTYKTIVNFFSVSRLEIVECLVKVADISYSTKGTSYWVKKKVKSNPHSYVYQYIIKAKLSLLEEDELMHKNLQIMNLDWRNIHGQLAIIRKQKWMNMIFPSGSKRRIWAKNILNCHKRGY